MRFYDRLVAVQPTPVVAMNRAIAVAETDGRESGLVLLDGLADELERYHLLHAARAVMLDQLGRNDEASQAYDRAAALARTEAEANVVAHRRAEHARPRTRRSPGT